MPYDTEAARWRALTIRDPNANGRFVYAVKTTNCYCRPTCPARLARRANVVFYDDAAAAEAAGYRVCKRCKPDETSYNDPQDKAVIKACRLIDEALREKNPKAVRLQHLAKNVGLTPRYLHKIFKDKTGQTPKEYAKARESGESTARPPTTASTPSDKTGATSEFGEFIFDDLVDLDFELPWPVDEAFVPATPDVPGPEMTAKLPVLAPAVASPGISFGFEAPWDGSIDSSYPLADCALGAGEFDILPPYNAQDPFRWMELPESFPEKAIESGCSPLDMSSNYVSEAQELRSQETYQELRKGNIDMSGWIL